MRQAWTFLNQLESFKVYSVFNEAVISPSEWNTQNDWRSFHSIIGGLVWEKDTSTLFEQKHNVQYKSLSKLHEKHLINVI